MEVKIVNSVQELLSELDKQNIQGFNRYELIQNYISDKARSDGVPVAGCFELTPFCNLDCKMCYVHMNSHQCLDQLLSVEEWKKIIRQAVDAGMIFAELSGGECLTYHGFKEVYLYLLSLGVRVAILTNGRLLTDEMVSFFSDYPPSAIQVTVYGSCDDAYEKVTGHRAFQEVIDGIKRVKNAGIPIQVCITPSRYMQDDIDALLAVVYSLQVKYRINGVTLPARAETGRQIEEYAVDLDSYFTIRRKNREHIQSELGLSRMRQKTVYVPPPSKETPGLPCGGGRSAFHVSWKGGLCPCAAFESISYDVRQGDFASAWTKVRETMALYEKPYECSQCILSEYCTTCSAEKSQGKLQGHVNPAVCKRLQMLINEASLTDDKPNNE